MDDAIDFGAFDAYQKAAEDTAAFPAAGDGRAGLISYLGLAAEAGSLLNIVKKWYLIEVPSEELSYEFVAEELGDVLWYLAMVARGSGLSLTQIAIDSLEKARARYRDQGTIPPFEALDGVDVPEERFPRLMIFAFGETKDGPYAKSAITLVHAEPNAFPEGAEDLPNGKKRGFTIGEDLGAMLTDNSRRVDGYRFHDAIHMAFAATLGWSPVLRSMLRLKRKSREEADEADDGARAIFTEEAIAAAVARLSAKRLGFVHELTVDGDVLDFVQAVVRDLEVERVPLVAWRPAIVAGMSVLRSLDDNHGGFVVCDLDAKTLNFVEPGTSVEEVIKRATGIAEGR